MSVLMADEHSKFNILKVNHVYNYIHNSVYIKVYYFVPAVDCTIIQWCVRLVNYPLFKVFQF